MSEGRLAVQLLIIECNKRALGHRSIPCQYKSPCPKWPAVSGGDREKLHPLFYDTVRLSVARAVVDDQYYPTNCFWIERGNSLTKSRSRVRRQLLCAFSRLKRATVKLSFYHLVPSRKNRKCSLYYYFLSPSFLNTIRILLLIRARDVVGHFFQVRAFFFRVLTPGVRVQEW